MKRHLIALLALSVLALTSPAKAQNLNVTGNLQLGCGTGTAAAGAVTLANKCGVITSEALVTAGLAAYTLTVTDTVVAAADLCIASVANGTNTQGTTAIGRVTPAAGSLVILAQNLHASQALNGTIVVTFVCFKP